MQYDHEYALHGGFDRARVGHILGIIAATAATLLAALVPLVIELAKELGWPLPVPQLILWPIGAVTIYAILYWWFNTYLWKYSLLPTALRVPNLNGEWKVEGQTLNPDHTPSYQWTATITIVQRWDRIRVRLKTAQSGSESISAALAYDEIDGYRLLYHYRNDPKIGEGELRGHRGFADLVFSKDLHSAEGEYFNGQGRFTFGRMSLAR